MGSARRPRDKAIHRGMNHRQGVDPWRISGASAIGPVYRYIKFPIHRPIHRRVFDNAKSGELYSEKSNNQRDRPSSLSASLSEGIQSLHLKAAISSRNPRLTRLLVISLFSEAWSTEDFSQIFCFLSLPFASLCACFMHDASYRCVGLIPSQMEGWNFSARHVLLQYIWILYLVEV